MNSGSQSTLLALGAALLIFSACSENQAASSPTQVVTHSAQDKIAPAAEYQLELLDLGFRAVTAIPKFPHIKDRSRAQSSVVTAALDLDQPERALAYSDKIDNWRRGLGYADTAYYKAARGDRDGAEKLLDFAMQVAVEKISEPNSQAWRVDRVKMRIAQTRALLGQKEEAMKIEATVVPSEKGKLGVPLAETRGATDFDAQVSTLEELFAGAIFEQMINAKQTCLILYDSNYADKGRRERLDELVPGLYAKFPANIRLELREAMALIALEHGDQVNARKHINAAQGIFDASKWLPEAGIPLSAKLAALHYRYGDVERAKSYLELALAKFETDKNQIINIDRAGVLRSIAEAYMAIEDEAAARKVYGQAIDAGLVNPNSRPRAEDLSATCISMAIHEFNPGSELINRINQICSGLTDPW